MSFGWFDATAAQGLGLQLAEMVMMGFPGKERKNANKEISVRAKLLKNLLDHAKQFKQTQNPNIYKKAKLANTFKWKLLEEGFESEFVDELTNQILLQMK